MAMAGADHEWHRCPHLYQHPEADHTAQSVGLENEEWGSVSEIERTEVQERRDLQFELLGLGMNQVEADMEPDLW